MDAQAGVIALESQEYRVEHPRGDWSQISADTLWNGMLSCLQRIAARHSLSGVAGIGFSCMSPGLIAFDRAGNVLVDPILYSDRRSGGEAQEILSRVGLDELFPITANNVMAGAISVTSMLWVRNHQPEIYEKIHQFGHINTLMAYRMTGEYAIDRSNASYTGLFDTVGERAWSPLLCGRLGIDEALLPPVLDSPQVCGILTAPEVIACGVPPRTPVVIGGADSPCASLACGVIAPGDICQSVGTTNVLTVCTDKSVFSRAYLNRCHVVPGLWIYQGAMSNAGSALTWARDTLCPDLALRARQENRSVFALMDEEAMTCAPGAGGVVFLPYLSGERCPVWDSKAKGVFFGIRQESARRDLVRAVLESTCYATRQLLDIAETVSGRRYPVLDTVGGGAKSLVWTQMKADILNRSMRMLRMTDASMLGAAMLAGIGAGVFRDAGEAAALHKKEGTLVQPRASEADRAVYDRRFETYLSLYDRLKDLF